MIDDDLVARLGTLLRAMLETRGNDLELARVLASPWCWPAQHPDLAALARGRGFEPPGPPRVGEALLVAVAAGRASLWELRPGPREAGDGRVHLGHGPSQAQLGAAAVVARDIPVLVAVPGAPPGWCVRHLATGGAGFDQRLEGLSFGLPMALAEASRFLGRPVPADLAATGVLDEATGAVKSEIEGLESKTAIIAGCALGVSRFLVPDHPEKKWEKLASAVASTIRPSLKVIAVADARAAIREAFGPVADLLHWADAAQAREAARRLFETARDGSNVLLGWASAGTVADRLAEDPRLDLDARREARFAARVAWRHAGRHAPMEWPDAEWLDAMDWPLQLRVIAHVVQAGADAGEPDVAGTIRRALGMVAPPRRRYPDDLKLLGAIGRAQAAEDDFLAAAGTLQQAVETWFDLSELSSASYALCELLRVTGIEGDAGAVRGIVERWVKRALARSDALSAAFLHLATGRALVQAGEPEAALDHLADGGPVAWIRLRDDLRAAQLRWWGRAIRALGRRRDAARVLERLVALGEERAGAQLPLARLDAALAGGDDLEPHRLRLLEAPYARDFRRLQRPGVTGRDEAVRFADLCRY